MVQRGVPGVGVHARHDALSGNRISTATGKT
jgi:hypothetical protein